jgi:hypothetical protein
MGGGGLRRGHNYSIREREGERGRKGGKGPPRPRGGDEAAGLPRGWGGGRGGGGRKQCCSFSSSLASSRIVWAQRSIADSAHHPDSKSKILRELLV